LLTVICHDCKRTYTGLSGETAAELLGAHWEHQKTVLPADQRRERRVGLFPLPITLLEPAI
jgi:transposase-like protein